MTGCARLRPLLTAIAALILSQPGAAACWIDDVTVLPFWTITNADPVSLEIVVGTSTTPAHLYQPTEMIINGNEFIIDLFVDGGPFQSPDTWVETMQLGTLSPGDYTYTVTQNGLEGSWCTGTHTESGTFCIEDVDCNEDACRCPVFVPTYTIMTLAGASGHARGINDVGQVVGQAFFPESGWRAFLWDNGVMTDLGSLSPTVTSMANDINNSGVIVAEAGNGGGPGSGFIWENGEITRLVDPPFLVTGYAINDHRQVVGRYRVPPPEPPEDHAFLWEDGVLTDLGTLGGSLSHARDINNAGQVVGYSWTDGQPGGAFLWQDGVMSDLGSLGFSSCEAYGIDSAGRAVGFCNLGPSAPALWENGEVIDLGALIEDPVGIANAINNAGQILFFYYLYDTATGTGAYLEDLIAPDSGWSDLRALDINDSGQIVGSGWIDGMHLAFLMTPVPPPPPIPTLSEWSAVLMVLTFLTAATLMFGRRDPRAGVRLEHR